MEWVSASLCMPQTLQNAGATAQQGLADAQTQTDNRLATLSLVSGQIQQSVNGVANACSDIDAVRQAYTALLADGGKFACIHPYLHPVGDRRGDYAYLTPEAAGEYLYDKLADPADISGMSAAVIASFRAVDHAGMAETLAAFNALFPVDELQLAERRARALDSLQQDKFITPTGPINPAWQGQTPQRHERTREMAAALGRSIAQAEAYAHQLTRPEDELAELLARKKTALQEAQSAWDGLKTAMEGGSGHAAYFAGSPGALREVLTKTPPPGAGYKLAALVCWTGEPARVQFFKEVFGL